MPCALPVEVSTAFCWTTYHQAVIWKRTYARISHVPIMLLEPFLGVPGQAGSTSLIVPLLVQLYRKQNVLRKTHSGATTRNDNNRLHGTFKILTKIFQSSLWPIVLLIAESLDSAVRSDRIAESRVRLIRGLLQ